MQMKQAPWKASPNQVVASPPPPPNIPNEVVRLENNNANNASFLTRGPKRCFRSFSYRLPRVLDRSYERKEIFGITKGN